MRIQFVLPFVPARPSGGARVVLEYANRLQARGHDVVVRAPWVQLGAFEAGPDRAKRALRKSAKAVKDAAKRQRPVWFDLNDEVAFEVVPKRLLVAADADVTVATGWRTAKPVADAAGDAGRAYLVQHHETWDGPASSVDATFGLGLHVVAVSSWLAEVAESHGTPGDAIRTVPNGLDLDVFRADEPIEGREPHVAMTWNPAAWKGGRDGLQAIAEARSRTEPFAVTLFGLEAAPTDLPDRVTYHRDPGDAAIARIYNEASIFVSASWAEGFGLPGAEAMACGAALVTTDSGGVRDYAEHDVTALVSPPNDPEAMADHLVSLLQDDTARARLAAAGHQRIQSFTWDRAVDAVEAWFAELTGAATT